MMNQPETSPTGPTGGPGGQPIPTSPPPLSGPSYLPAPTQLAGQRAAAHPSTSTADIPQHNGQAERSSSTPMWAWALIGILAITTASFAGLYFTRDTSPSASPGSATRSNPTNGGGPNNQAEPSPVSPDGWIQSGTYSLPDEIPPGLYRVGTDFQITSDNGDYESSFTTDGTTLMLIPENAPKGTVTLAGGAWLVDESKPLNPLQYVDGTYLVGVDLEPGTYRVSPATRIDESTYFARLDENLKVISNDFRNDSETDNTVTVEILPTDFAFVFNGHLEKID